MWGEGEGKVPTTVARMISFMMKKSVESPSDRTTEHGGDIVGVFVRLIIICG